MLWYCSRQTLLGDTPILDFQSYDPGRYYWIAMWMRFFSSDTLGTVIKAAMIFQAVGLFIAIVAIRKVEHDAIYLIIAALVIVAWMFPRHKLFEHSISIFLVCSSAFYIEKQNINRAFFLGIIVGACAFFGRNHGVYGFIGGSVAILLALKTISLPACFRLFVFFLIGIFFGYLPMFVLIISKSGFLNAFTDSVLSLWQLKETNLPLPVPWPWTIKFADVLSVPKISKYLVGFFFMVIPIFSVVAFGTIVKYLRGYHVHPLNLASFLFVPLYGHHAFARADAAHLAQGIIPFLLVILTILSSIRSKQKKRIGVAFLLGLSVMAVFPGHYRTAMIAYGIAPISTDINAKQFMIDPKTSELVAGVSKLDREKFGTDSVFFAPYIPAMYPMTLRTSPTWEIYNIFPMSEFKQKVELKRFKANNVKWAVIGNAALDGRDELHFRNIRPILWRHLMDSFDILPDSGLPQPYLLFRHKSI